MTRREQTNGAMRSAQSTAADASQRALMLARELENVRSYSARLAQNVRVLSAPDLIAAVRRENPLGRAGLAFAGANVGRNGDDDGVLTALEASALDHEADHMKRVLAAI